MWDGQTVTGITTRSIVDEDTFVDETTVKSDDEETRSNATAKRVAKL